MLNKSRLLIAALLASAMSGVSSAMTRFAPASSQGPSSTPVYTPARRVKPPKAKGIRTIRAEGSYGRNLRVAFDSKRRTPAQQDAFNATIR